MKTGGICAVHMWYNENADQGGKATKSELSLPAIMLLPIFACAIIFFAS